MNNFDDNYFLFQAVNIYNNYNVIFSNPQIKKYIEDSGTMVKRYREIYHDFEKELVESIYLSLTLNLILTLQ